MSDNKQEKVYWGQRLPVETINHIKRMAKKNFRTQAEQVAWLVQQEVERENNSNK